MGLAWRNELGIESHQGIGLEVGRVVATALRFCGNVAVTVIHTVGVHFGLTLLPGTDA